MIINGISHWNTGSWFTLSRVLALSNTHITHLILFLAAANLTTFEQEVVFPHPACQGKLRNTIHTSLNHTKSSHQKLCCWGDDPRSSPKHLSFQFASSSEVPWSCQETAILAPRQEQFGFAHILSHYQDIQLFCACNFMPATKNLIKLCEVYLGFSNLGSKRTQTQTE